MERGGKRRAQETRDTVSVLGGLVDFELLILLRTSVPKHFICTNHLGEPDGHINCIFCRLVFFFFPFKCGGKQRRYLHLAGYVPFLPPSTCSYLRLELSFRREILFSQQTAYEQPTRHNPHLSLFWADFCWKSHFCLI